MESLNYSLLRDFDYLLKYILLGDASVGKSAMLLKYTEDVFEDHYICTIGVDFKIKTLDLNGKKVKIQIWDTAGQERFRLLTNYYFKGSHGCVVVFDITNRDTFQKLPGWLKEYKEQNSEYKDNIIIVGNKMDKRDNRQVSVEEARKLASEFGSEYLETSAKTGENLSKAFERLTKSVILNMKAEHSHSSVKVTPQEDRSCCYS